jgi:hypothetical protein
MYDLLISTYHFGIQEIIWPKLESANLREVILLRVVKVKPVLVMSCDRPRFVAVDGVWLEGSGSVGYAVMVIALSKYFLCRYVHCDCGYC